MNIKMLKYLQNEEEIIPQDYDGSYELVTAVVNAYRDVPPMTLDYQDLNTVYLMCIGTWRHGYEKKKEQLRNSHLSKENQEMLCKLVERLKAESAVGKYACKGSYIGHDTDMGMFGSGFFSFQNKTNDQSVRDFIAMCIDLLDMTDDEEMFQRAEGVLDKTFKGMRASSASVVLHCLKPNTFPIINGNAGNESVFTALDIPLKKPALLENYIPNCRKIKEFRDQNVTFKNYRVMDIAMWETTHSSAPIKKLIANYKENFQKWIPEELYKWQAVYCFRKNWDIHAENFAQMLKESLKEASILLDTGYEYPKKMMLQFAERDPEAVREMYRKLFEESHDLTTRVRDFQNSTEKLWIQYGFQAAGKQHYQSERTICRYLFFYNPEKYYLFQPEKLIRVAEQIGYDLDYQNKDAENINIYNDMADMFLREVEQDENLIEMLRQELTDFCYEDEKLHLLTDDII